MTVMFSVKGKAGTYAVCGGDDDRTGDEGEAVVHADLKCGFPATTRGPGILSTACGHTGPRGSVLNHPLSWLLCKTRSMLSRGPSISNTLERCQDTPGWCSKSVYPGFLTSWQIELNGQRLLPFNLLAIVVGRKR